MIRFPEMTSRYGHHFAHQRLGFFEALKTTKGPRVVARVDTTRRLIRADSLNNHRWQETEAKFLSAGSSDSLPPQDRWKTSLPPGQNTTAPRPRHI